LNKSCEILIHSLTYIQILRKEMREEDSRGFYDIVTSDTDVIKILSTIQRGKSDGATQLQSWLEYWSKYEYLYTEDMEKTIEIFSKHVSELSSPGLQLNAFEEQITTYRDRQFKIQDEQSSHKLYCVQIDCSMLKSSLVDHCVQWQNSFYKLLNTMARTELEQLHDMFESNTKKLEVKPLNLDQLAQSVKLRDSLDSSRDDIEARFAPVRDQYQLLAQFDVSISELEHQRLTSLSSAWSSFGKMLEKSKVKLQKSKKDMRSDLEQALLEFETMMETLREETKTSLPYSDLDTNFSKAFEMIGNGEIRVQQTKSRMQDLQSGAEIFNMDMPDDRNVKLVENDIELLKSIWTVRLIVFF